MVLLNLEMESLGVKIFAAWRRYSHYVVQFLVPDNEETLKRVNDILMTWAPGETDFCLEGDAIDTVEHFTDRDFIGRQLSGYHVIKCRVWYVKKDT